MANRIQLRRDGAQQWANVNPILAQGELGIEIDTSRIKIGDGVTPWNSLKYERPVETETNTANTLVKRDADGNFSAGAITANLIGNAATSTRLANARLITLSGDMTGSGTFDGSANLTLVAELGYVTSLPHYDAQDLGATGTYTQFEVDSRGRIVNAFSPNTLSQYGITDAQPLDSDLSAIAGLTSQGLITRTATGVAVTRSIAGSAGRILTSNSDGVGGNPTIDLADTTVVVGSYNTESKTSVPLGAGSASPQETVNTPKFTVDRYGRLTAALTVPIATATQGTKDALFSSATTYARYAKVKTVAGRLYQSIRSISSGGAEPNHTDTSDTNGWRYLGSALTEQKGLASFDQEDFDVDANGHVTIADRGIDNIQLQNNRISFADGNSKEDFELDQELTSTSGYRGFNYLNYVKVNDISGNLLFSANNVDNSGAGGVDINVDTNISAANIILDRPGTSPLQTIERTAGDLKIYHNVNSSVNRTLEIISQNIGSGSSQINIRSDGQIYLESVNNDVRIEDFYIINNVISSTNSTIVLDPAGIDDITGTVQIKGNLQVDGTTTTVNSTTITVDDPIITLGGDTTPTVDDNKDRGIEFKYYDTQARLGFYGWDENYTTLAGTTGGYHFLYNATNTSEVFSGTDAGIVAGNLALTSNVGSTSSTTGSLVVTGGVGISQNLNVAGNSVFTSQGEFNHNLTLKADNRDFKIQTAAGVDKFTVDYDNGNTVIEGTLDVQLESRITDNLIVAADNKEFIVRTAAGVNKFVVDTDNGNTNIQGTLNVVSGVDFDSTLNVDAKADFNANVEIDGITTIHNNIILDTTGKTFTITNGSVTKFQVTSTTGNTDIEGNLNVAQNIYFESTNNITVDTSSATDITIVGGDYGSLRHDGGAYIAQDALIGGDLYISGALDVKDSGTARTAPSKLNNVDVRYHAYFGSTNAQNATYANDPSANVRIAGGLGVVQDLHVGDDFYVGKEGSTDTVEFEILGESGNTTIGRTGQGSNSVGTLTVHGDVTLNRDLFANRNVTIGDASVDTLTVNSTTTFNAPVTLSSGQNLLVGGNTTITGNLTVNGTTTTVNSTSITVDDPIITLGGDTAPASDDNKDRGVEFRYFDTQARLGFFGWDDSAARYVFLHAATNSAEVFTGTRSGIDAGSIKLFDTTNSTNSASGTLIVGGGVGVGLDLYVGGLLNVTGTASITGNTTITGTANIVSDFSVNTNRFNVVAASGNTSIAGTLNVTGATTLSNTANIVGNFSVNTNKFNVIAASGNTSIAGTLGVTAATTLSNTLTLTGAADLNSTLDVAGLVRFENIDIPNINATNFTILSSDYGAFRFDGGGYVAGQVLFADDVYVAGELKIKDTGGATGSTLNNITVRYKGFFGSLTSYTPTFSTDNNANIRVYGGISVGTDIQLGRDLIIGKTSSGATAKASISGTTGNALFTGTLGVTGITNLSSSLNVTGAIVASSTINVTGSLIVNTDKFSVTAATGNTSVAGTLSAGGNFAVNTNKFNVIASSGNTSVAGSLDVTGVTSLSSSLTVTGAATLNSSLGLVGNFNINTNKFSVVAASGNTSVAGTLNVAGNTTLSAALGVTGLLTATGGVSGDVTGNLTGTADKSNLAAITNTTSSNLTYYPTFVSTTTGYSEIRTDSDNLTYNPATNTLQVSNFRSTTDFTVEGNLTITGTVLYGQSQVGDISNHNTDDLSEGTTNLYFTNERVDDRVSNLIIGGTGISSTYSDNGDGAGSLTLAIDFAEFSTTNIAEGTKQFFTTERARTSVSAAGDLAYNSLTGVFSVTTFKTADARSSISVTDAGGAGSLTYSSSTGVITYTGPNITSFGESLIDDVDAAAARSTLGLGTAATTNSTAYATAAQGTTADDTNSDLSSLYTALVAIGNNASITTVTQLKAALAALVRP
jgi:hypothetical protein